MIKNDIKQSKSSCFYQKGLSQDDPFSFPAFSESPDSLKQSFTSNDRIYQYKTNGNFSNFYRKVNLLQNDPFFIENAEFSPKVKEKTETKIDL